MNKRIALGTAITLVVTLAGMSPASAAKPPAPSVASEICARAGGSVEARSNTGDVRVTSDGTNLRIDGGACVDAMFAFAGLTGVVIQADGYGVEFKLEKGNDDVFANYHDVAFTVSADTYLRFNGGSMTAALRDTLATVGEETFLVGTLTGSWYAGEKVVFSGGSAADSFDASGVTSVTVQANGGAGNDVLKGGAGPDDLTGGAGNDTVYGFGGDDAISVNGDGSVAVERGHSGKYTVVTLPSGADAVWAGAGADVVTADISDTVAPGDGADEVDGNISTLVYSDSSAPITVNLATAAGTVKSTAGDDFYTGSVATFVGSEFADTFVGNGSANAFYGEAGADIFVTGAGNDEVGGGGGTDAVRAQSGSDLIFGDSGADTINGGVGDDTIWMGGGDDIAYGSAGDDVLRGQEGTDQAWGGRDSDICAAEVTNRCEFTK